MSRRDGEPKNNAFVEEQSGYSQAWDRNQYYVYANGHQIARANLGGNVDAISGLTVFDQGGSASAATVLAGDTLASIAQRVYGNSSYWYILAAANGQQNDQQLVPGTTLQVPTSWAG